MANSQSNHPREHLGPPTTFDRLAIPSPSVMTELRTTVGFLGPYQTEIALGAPTPALSTIRRPTAPSIEVTCSGSILA